MLRKILASVLVLVVATGIVVANPHASVQVVQTVNHYRAAAFTFVPAFYPQTTAYFSYQPQVFQAPPVYTAPQCAPVQAPAVQMDPPVETAPAPCVQTQQLFQVAPAYSYGYSAGFSGYGFGHNVQIIRNRNFGSTFFVQHGVAVNVNNGGIRVAVVAPRRSVTVQRTVQINRPLLGRTKTVTKTVTRSR
jgi:hypothetical protein